MDVSRLSISLLTVVNVVYAGVVTINLNSTFESGSYMNDAVPPEALSGGCFRSGVEKEPFWKVELPEPVLIKSIVLTGEYSGDLYVRIGNNTDHVGRRRGHDSNRLCRMLGGSGPMMSREFICEQEHVGKVVSVSGVTPDDAGNSLMLCHVDLVQ